MLVKLTNKKKETVVACSFFKVGKWECEKGGQVSINGKKGKQAGVGWEAREERCNLVYNVYTLI